MAIICCRTKTRYAQRNTKLPLSIAACLSRTFRSSERNRIMVELTDEQKKVIFQLGRTDSVFESVSEHVIDQLVQMGLLYYRSKNNICFTNEGERIYQQLKKMKSLA